jgi:hypothetical protein
MRKLIFASAALLLSAAPLAAQQATSELTPAPSAAVAAEPAAPQPAALYPTTEHVKQVVRAQEERRSEQSPIGSKDWWYLVAAVAIGVIIAAVLL